MNKGLMAIAVIIGLILLIIGYIYVSRPAGVLPTWLPGYAAGSSVVHIKHGIAAFLLGAVAIIFGWFKSAPRAQA